MPAYLYVEGAIPARQVVSVDTEKRLWGWNRAEAKPRFVLLTMRRVWATSATTSFHVISIGAFASFLNAGVHGFELAPTTPLQCGQRRLEPSGPCAGASATLYA
jgi:hypothetical protein